MQPLVLGMDTFEGTYDRSLLRGARAAMSDVLGLRRNERVLIIGNPGRDQREISMALFDAAVEAKAAPTLAFQREKGQFDFAEEEVIKAMASNPQVVISISKDRMGKDAWGMRNGYEGKRRYDHIFDLLYEEKRIRAFWSPGITRPMWTRTVPIDYTQLRRDCARVGKELSKAVRVRVSAPGGTDITVGVEGRAPKLDDGNFREPGRAGNLPSGEVYISPALGTTNGTIVFDGSIVINTGELIVKEPIVARVKDGFIAELEGGDEAELLEESIRTGERKAREGGRKGDIRPAAAEAYARNAWAIGELGIGLNRKARIVANMLEDEKAYGTCHFAVGSNYDGDGEALIHLDCLVKRPTVVAVDRSGRERELMVSGRLVWD